MIPPTATHRAVHGPLETSHATRAIPVLVLTLLLLVPLVSLAASMVEARIVGITDGDTVKALVDGHVLWKVRLAEIDAPEKGQPWGRRARQALARMIFQKDVRIQVHGKDRYGRHIGTIFLGGRDINRAMIREGHAWVYRKYMRDRSLLEDERAARRAGRGLWSLPEASRVPPWTWRSSGHRRKAQVAPAPADIPRPSRRG